MPNTTPKSSSGTDKPPDTKNSAKCTIPQDFKYNADCAKATSMSLNIIIQKMESKEV